MNNYFMSFSNKNPTSSAIKRFGTVIIFLGSIFISLVLVEFFLGFLNTNKTDFFPKTPKFINSYQSNPHFLINGSILYVAPGKKEFRTFGYKFKTNSWGFREKDFTEKKNKDIFRILVFGDSFTFGIGIDNDHRYTNVLEEMLSILKIKAEVINFGMGGYSTDQEHDLMKLVLKSVECDLVIIGVFSDDTKMTTKTSLLTYTNVGRSKISKIENELRKNKKFALNNFRNLKNIPHNEPKEFIKVRKWYQDTNIYKFFEIRTNINIDKMIPTSARWKKALDEFRGMKKLTQKYDLPPPIAVLLNYGQVEPKKNNFNNPKGNLAQNIHFYQFLANELEKESFHIVDTLPLFKKFSGMTMATSEWERHSNYLGHYIYARSIKDYLLFNNLIPNRFKKNNSN
jgi:hypothetical protein